MRCRVVFPMFCCVALCGLLASIAHCANWPNWRGPDFNGVVREGKGFPTKWSSTENVLWKIVLPGKGASTPIVWEDRIIVTCAIDKSNGVLCLDRNGKQLWHKTIGTEKPGKHGKATGCNPSAVTDGKLLYVSFLDHGKMFISAYDFAGEEVWKVWPGVFSSVHGYCSSPIIFEDKLIINGDHDGDAYLVAIKKSNGDTVWKTPRENRTRSYCTPIVREIDGRTQMVLSGNKCVASYDPHDGSRHWIIDGPTEQFVASVVYSHDLLFVTGGFPEHHVLTIKPNGAGNVTSSHIAWRHTGKLASYVPSPIAVGDYFLIVSDDGLATCLDARTGKVQWQNKLSRHSSASLVAAGGLVYFLDDFGVTQVVKPGPEFEAVAVNNLFDQAQGEGDKDLCSASPAISQGQIFIRSDKFLYCIGKAAPTTAQK